MLARNTETEILEEKKNYICITLLQSTAYGRIGHRFKLAWIHLIETGYRGFENKELYVKDSFFFFKDW